METKQRFKNKAILLRQKGLSYSEIRQHLPVAKSTLSLWLKTVLLPEEHRKRLYTKQVMILARGPHSQKERRKREVQSIISRARSEIPTLITGETLKLMGAALYWAEGCKTQKFSFVNSDPFFIVFMTHWVEEMFGVSRKTLHARLNIYPQQNDADLRKFWSQLTGIPLENFGKTFVKPRNKGYKKNNLYYGTMSVLVPKGTDMRHKVFGWIEGSLKNIQPHVDATIRRWASLREVARPTNI